MHIYVPEGSHMVWIGKCSNVEFFQGPSWWKDGTFFSLYGGHRNGPRSHDAKLSMDLSADDVRCAVHTHIGQCFSSQLPLLICWQECVVVGGLICTAMCIYVCHSPLW